MKRVCLLLFAFAVILLPALCRAEGEFDDAWELYGDWEMNGYPEDVGGVCTTDGGETLTILVVDGSVDAKYRITRQIASREGYRFLACGVSYRELERVRDEILERYRDEVDSAFIGWDTVGDDQKGFGESGLEYRVIVEMAAPITDSFVREIEKEYGDLAILHGEIKEPEPSEEDSRAVIFALGAAAAVTLGAGVFFGLENYWLEQDEKEKQE